MSAGLFVTGTDTGCGKTHVAAALIRLFRDQGLRVGAFKPVAAGAHHDDGKLRNDDALTLAVASGLDVPYRMLNPYCLAPAIAPHLAAAEAGVKFERAVVMDAFDALRARCDLVIAEGAGGWAVPLDDELDMAGLAEMLGLPVVLVVGLRLGCINHARLSERAIAASGASLAGWIGSQVDPQMQRVDENLSTLEDYLDAPCLGVLAHPAAAPPSRQRPLSPASLLGLIRG